MSALSMEAVLERLQSIPPHADEVRLYLIECRHCGTRYWHELGDLADGGKIAGGPCCFGYPVLDVSRYPTELDAQAARMRLAPMFPQLIRPTPISCIATLRWCVAVTPQGASTRAEQIPATQGEATHRTR